MVLDLKWLSDGLAEVQKSFYQDPRVCHLPLLGPPWPMACIVVLYILLVLRWGPRLMAHRKAFDVTILMQAYNVIQIVLNLWIFVDVTRYTLLQPYFKLSCQGYNPQDTRPALMNLRYATYGYYISKYLDILDTVFFLLRKKNNQITFLHVYHHSLMIFGTWSYTTLLFGTHFVTTGLINSLIHVCMYSYYFLAALKLKSFDLLPWKRRLTQLQILQFCILSVHFTMPFLNNWCKLPNFWLWVAFSQNIFMLLLFVNFYIKTYVRPKPKKL